MRDRSPAAHSRHPRTRHRASWVAALVSAVLVTAACTPSTSDEASAGIPVDAAAIQAVSATLPADAGIAAEQLVGAILADDTADAVASTAELLRRSGHPIVSVDGRIIAMPDEAALIDMPLYAEFIPLLTTATRAGDRFTLEEFATLLTAVTLTEADAAPAEIAAAIGTWARASDAHAISRTAASAVRALSGHRGSVLYAGSDAGTDYLDPLQTVILLGHATSDVGPVARDATPTPSASAAAGPGIIDWLLGVQPAHAAPAGLCGEISKFLSSGDKPGDKVVDDTTKGRLKDHLAQELLTEGGKEAFDKASEAAGRAGAAASAIMLMLGSRLELTADKMSTHFKHTAGSRAEHIVVTATAVFDPGFALETIECFVLAGMDVPKPGPMPGMTIRWDTQQPLAGDYKKGGAQLLNTVSADSVKMLRGAKTGDDGKATLELKPPVEDPAGVGKKITAKAIVIAKLDKERFPVELGDAMGLLTGAVTFAIGKTFELLKDLLVKVGLPSQAIALEVDYHGIDIIVAKGENSVNLILADIPRVYVDLVSCAGEAGPFVGSAGYDGVTSSGMLKAAGAITGVPVPAEFSGKDNPISVMTNDRRGLNPFFIMKGEGGAAFLDGTLTFVPHLPTTFIIMPDLSIGRPVGSVEILLGGSSTILSKLEWPMIRVPSDDRCPVGGYFHDGL